MEQIQQNVQTVRLDELNNIAIWINVSSLLKVRQSPIAKWTLT
jgi:hypothetical protein